ncbi:MAG: hypothetical protein ABSA72_08960, partial [Nitrososphaerales archaeon]
MSGIFKEINLPPAAEAVLTAPAVSGVSPTGSTVGVLGQSVAQAGVYGSSKSGDGVDGVSDSGVGVRGTSNSQSGVAGQSKTADGVWGEGGNNGVYGKTSNDQGSGVYGINWGKGPGVTAASQYGPSLSAAGYNGNPAAELDGDVNVSGSVSAAGALTAGSLTTKGDINAANVNVTGDVILLNSSGA